MQVPLLPQSALAARNFLESTSSNTGSVGGVGGAIITRLKNELVERTTQHEQYRIEVDLKIGRLQSELEKSIKTISVLQELVFPSASFIHIRLWKRIERNSLKRIIVSKNV